jgi:hypothetical protein
MSGVRNEPGKPPAGDRTTTDRPAVDDSKVVLPYQGRTDARRAQRSTFDLFAGIAAVLVLAISASGLVVAQLAGLSGWLRGRAGLYAVTTVFSIVLVYWSYRVARYYFQGTR